MKGLKKRLFSLFFAGSFLLAQNEFVFAKQIDMTLFYDGEYHRYVAEEITMMVDGRQIENLPMPPIILNDYTLVPVREIFEQMGAAVMWNGETNSIFISYGNDLVLLQIDNKVAYLNQDAIVMEVAPKIINGKTMIPVRFAAEALGFKVGWDGANRIVSVDFNNEILTTVTPTETPATTVPEYSEIINESDTTQNLDIIVANVEDIIPAVDNSTYVFTQMNYPDTSVTAINMVDNGRYGVDIIASGEIGRVEKLLLPDNRLAIDIYGAEMKVDSKEMIPANTSAYSEIRIAQNQLTPVKITRVVLELKSGVTFTVAMAADRKSVSVDFERNTISNVGFYSDGTKDYVTITGDRAPSVNISRMSGPDRLVIDMPYADISTQTINVLGRFSNSVRVAQFDENTARVVVDLIGMVKHTTDYEGSTLKVCLQEPTYKNVSYDNASSTLMLTKSGFSPLSATSIIKVDDYTHNKYVFQFLGDFSSVYGYGEYEINDSNLRSVEIDNVGGMTQITVNERKVFEAVISEDSNYVYIKFVNPKEVYNKIVVIDAGHGGGHPGTIGAGVQEKDITIDISNRVLRLLEENYYSTGIKVYATRIDDKFIDPVDRGPYANEIGDLFVSIHINSAAPNQAPNGIETYYYPHDNDNYVGITTKQTADIFHKNLINATGAADRKVKENNYIVLVNTTIPSTLLELGFLSNPAEAQKILDSSYRQVLAETIYKSIVETFSVYTPRR